MTAEIARMQAKKVQLLEVWSCNQKPLCLARGPTTQEFLKSPETLKCQPLLGRTAAFMSLAGFPTSLAIVCFNRAGAQDMRSTAQNLVRAPHVGPLPTKQCSGPYFRSLCVSSSNYGNHMELSCWVASSSPQGCAEARRGFAFLAFHYDPRLPTCAPKHETIRPRCIGQRLIWSLCNEILSSRG